MSAELSLRHEGRADGYTLSVGGELDMATTRELIETVAQLVGQGVAPLTLDLGALTFMDSTGLRGIFAIRDLCEAHRCELELTLGPRHVQRVFELTGTGDLLPFGRPGAGEEAGESFESKRRRFAGSLTDRYLPNADSA
jgi:anti-anti-sigma factor